MEPGGFFIGLFVGFFLGLLVTLKTCVDVDEMGGPGQYCYPNSSCDAELICVQLTNQPSVCSQVQDIIPKSMKPAAPPVKP